MKTNLKHAGLAIAVLLFCLVVLTLAEPGQGQSGVNIPWKVLSSGGNVNSASAHYRLEGTMAQSTVGEALSLNRRLNHGFWLELEPVTCCEGRVGDANREGEYPDEVTLGDIMYLVDVKFISGDCSKLACLAEADVNQDGGMNPTCDDHVTLGDIMTLVDFLFITGPDVAVLNTCL
jgi:hypothetical protein